jgi:hypothetical protein
MDNLYLKTRIHRIEFPWIKAGIPCTIIKYRSEMKKIEARC